MLKRGKMVELDFKTPNTLEDFEFIRLLRLDPRTIGFFIDQREFSLEQQIKYMEKYSNFYHICMSKNDKINLGFIGVVENDIRLCVVPYYQNMGVGIAMLSYVKNLYPQATGKIKTNNIASIKAFDKAGIPYKLI